MEQYKTRNQRVSDKFQSCGEIERAYEFEVVSVNVKGKYHLNQKI